MIYLILVPPCNVTTAKQNISLLSLLLLLIVYWFPLVFFSLQFILDVNEADKENDKPKAQKNKATSSGKGKIISIKLV